MVFADAAPYIAGSAAALTALIGAFSFVTALQAKQRTADVDRIGAAQDALIGTIDHLQTELARERSDHTKTRRRIAMLQHQLTEARTAITELRAEIAKLSGDG